MGAPGRSPKPIVDPVAELRAQQQDPTVQFGGTPPQGPQQATQNGSWMDAIFPNRPAPNLNYMTQPGGAEAFGNKLGNTKPSDLKDMASAAWRVNNYVNPVTRFAQGTYDLASGPLLGNLAADKPMSEWFSSPKPPAPAVAPTAAHGEMPPEVQAATPTAKEDNQKLDLAAATAGLPEPKPAKQGGWGLADLFGLLLGGRNFLHYKQAEEEAQKGRDFSAEQYDKRRAGEVEDLTKTLGSREQALGVEYAKAMAALKQKADNEENVDARAALRAGSTPGSPVNVKQAQAILDEARRARAIQQKKNQE